MESIVNKILEDAEIEAKAIIARAETNSRQQIIDVKREIEDNKDFLMESAKKLKQVESEQNEMLAKTIASRKNSNDKQEVISNTFEMAKAKILAMSAKEKKEIATKLVKKYRRKDDTVIERDGGVVLENKDYVLSLTASDLLDSLRQEIELEIANLLFG